MEISNENEFSNKEVEKIEKLLEESRKIKIEYIPKYSFQYSGIENGYTSNLSFL